MGNLHHLYVPTRNWYICWNENVPHYASQGFPLCREKYPHHSPEIFYQLLSTNWYFLNTTLVVSHTHTHTHACIHTHLFTHAHTSLKVPFSSLNFCLSDEELGYLNNLKFWMSDKNSSQKRKAKLKTVISNLN